MPPAALVSAVLFGALAGSGTLPFQRMAFEATIRRGGVGVDSSVRAFNAGFEAAASGNAPRHQARSAVRSAGARRVVQTLVARHRRQAVDRVAPDRERGRGAARRLPERGLCQALSRSGWQPIVAIEAARPGKPDELLTEVARHLALAMAYEDTVRVAELKIRASRFERVREEVMVKPGQLLEIVEFMHPRTQEIAETLPAAARPLHSQHGLGARHCRRLHAEGPQGEDLVDPRLPAALHGREPEAVAVALAALDRREQARQTDWLARSWRLRAQDYALAVEVAHADRSGEGLWRHP